MKPELLDKIAKALEVSEGALKDYGVETAQDLMALLLQLEEGYGLVPSEDGMGLAVDPKAPHAPKLAHSIKTWAEKRAELERGEVDEAAYADWKASFWYSPGKFRGRHAKKPSNQRVRGILFPRFRW